MAYRRTLTLATLVLIGASAAGLWYWQQQTDDTGTGKPPPVETQATSTPPTPSTTDASAMTTPPAKQLIAEWRSFSYNPPRYAIENLLVYSDFSCEVTVADDDKRRTCAWKRVDGDAMEVVFANKSRIRARLSAPLSTEGKKKPGTAGYLIADLGDRRKQLFVLAGSDDDKMVRDTVLGEWDWSNGKFKTGVDHLRNAYARGSSYARLRLGWIYATVAEFHLPKVALRLLEPLAVNRNFGTLDALAAAYAANKQFDQAVNTATAACKLAPEAERGGCLQRLEQYRKQQPFVVSVAPG